MVHTITNCQETLHEHLLEFLKTAKLGESRLQSLEFGLLTLTQFIPFYETSVHGISAGLAGFMASVISITPIPGAILGGWLSDKLRNRKAFMLYPSIAFAVAIMFIDVADFSQTIMLLVLLGLMDSFAFTAMYAAPFQMPHLIMDQKAISISLMNGVQIMGAFILPILFTLVADTHGYKYAWLTTGLFAIAFVPLLFRIKEPFKQSLSALADR